MSCPCTCTGRTTFYPELHAPAAIHTVPAVAPQTTGPGTGADLLKNVDPKLRDQILNEARQL